MKECAVYVDDRGKWDPSVHFLLSPLLQSESQGFAGARLSCVRTEAELRLRIEKNSPLHRETIWSRQSNVTGLQKEVAAAMQQGPEEPWSHMQINTCKRRYHCKV